MANESLSNAKDAKRDEFYTQFSDIQREINAYIDFDKDVFRGKTILLPCDDPEWSNFTKFFAQNFESFGIKKLISTSFAYNSKKVEFDYQPTLFETIDPRFEILKSKEKGKIFTLTKDENQDGKINIDDLKFDYLDGDGDFRSEEVKLLRDEADIIITNPPFSLFREFVAWLVESKKKFLILGNPNLLSKRDIFPLFQNNTIWCGCKSMSEDSYFIIPEQYKIRLLKENKEGSGYKIIDGNIFGRTQAMWYTNLEHGRRHEPIQLMSMDDNIKFSKHKKNEKWNYAYKTFENYNAIEIPFIDAIPKDYSGIMAVPISFMGQYCPEQFEIIGRTGDIDWCQSQCNFFTPCDETEKKRLKKLNKTWRLQNAYMLENNKPKTFYDRIFIKFKESWKMSHKEDFRR